jgi:hypothetical protein
MSHAWGLGSVTNNNKFMYYLISSIPLDYQHQNWYKYYTGHQKEYAGISIYQIRIFSVLPTISFLEYL